MDLNDFGDMPKIDPKGLTDAQPLVIGRPAAPSPPVAPPAAPLDLPDKDAPISLAAKEAAQAPAPDEAAKLLDYEKELGIPAHLASQSEAHRKTAALLPHEWRRLHERTPGLAEFLASPRNLSVAHDDVETLGWLERKFRLLKEQTVGTYYQNQLGKKLYEKYWGRGLEWQGRDTPEVNAEIERLRKEGKQTIMPKGWFERALSTIANIGVYGLQSTIEAAPGALGGAATGATAAAIAGQLGPQIATPEEIITIPAAAMSGFTAGVVAGGADFMRQVSAGHMVDKLVREYGIDVDRAKMIAGWSGMFEAVLEQVGFMATLRMFPGARQIVSKSITAGIANALGKPAVRSALANASLNLAEGISANVFEEVTQEISNDLAVGLARCNQGQIDPSEIVSQIDWKGIGQIAKQTALGVGLIGAVGFPVNYLSFARAVNPSAPKLAEAVQEAQEKSKLAGRSPEIFEEYVEKVREKTGGPDRMFIKAGAIEELFQKGEVGSDDVAEALDKLGIDPEEYQEAVALGLSVSFDTKKVAALMKSPLGEKVKSKLSFVPDVPDKAMVDDLMKRQAVPWPTEEVLKVKQGIKAAGRPEQEADLAARLLGARARVWSLQTGQAPAEYFKRFIFQEGQEPGAAAAASETAPAAPKAGPAQVQGTETKILTGRQSMPAVYAVMEAKDLLPSHDPTSFKPTAGYPEGVQERRYDTDEAEQLKVVRNADQLEPLYVINDNPDAVNGPPIVTPEGVALGGNSRAMSIIRAYQAGRGDVYRQALEQKATAFGLDAEQLAGMEHPVLVRVVAPATSEAKDLHRLATAFNKAPTQAMADAAQTASLGQNVSEETLQGIGEMLANVDTTLRSLLDREKSARAILNMLEKDGVITEQEVNRYWNKKYGKLTDEGKRLVERTIMGSVVADADLLENAPAAALNKVLGALSALAKIKARGEEWDISPDILAALEIITQAAADPDIRVFEYPKLIKEWEKRRKTKPDTPKPPHPLDRFFSQPSLLGQDPTAGYGPKAKRLAYFIATMSPNKVRDALTGYAREAAQTMGGQKTLMAVNAEDAFAEYFRLPENLSPPSEGVLFQTAPPVESEAFKRWFGDSKVVDKNGKPLVVYHGTNQKIDAFDLERSGSSTYARSSRGVIWFTDSKKVAQEYADLAAEKVIADVKNHEKKTQELLSAMEKAESRGDWDEYDKLNAELEKHELGAIRAPAQGANIVEAYLKAENPKEVDVNGRISTGEVAALIAQAKDEGHDSLILRGIEDSPESMTPSTQYVVFSPTQVKSVYNRGTFDPNDPRILFQSAFHGSPYRFDKFTLEHIGRGEGAQAYGWGLYFAGNKEVAEWYRGKLEAGRGASDDDVIARIINAADGDLKKAAQIARDRARRGGGERFLKYAKKLDEGYDPRGQLYEVEIPDADVLLDWDKPLSEQSEAVKKVFEKINADREIKHAKLKEKAKLAKNQDRMDDYGQIVSQMVAMKPLPPDMKGSGLYNNLVYQKGQSPRAASEYLNSLGIKGLKYLDGSSRGKGEGSHNYVIFDDEAIQILNTYYQGKGPYRGSVRFEDDRAIISFFEAADISTAPHEIFHVWRRELEALAMDPSPAMPGYEYVKRQLREDWEAANRFVGAKVGETWTREQEEKFADAGLQYLMTGKIPVPELRGILDRLRSWFVQMFQAIRDQGRVSPEMEQVFSRLVATDQEIELAEVEGGVAPMFNVPPQGVSPADWKDYTDQAKKASEGMSERIMNNRIALLHKSLPGWIQEGLAWARDREEQKILSEFVARGGLSKDEVLNHLSPELYDQLRKKRVGLVKKEGGVSLEAEAAERGMDPRDLADMLLKAQSLKDLAREYAQRKVAEMYAELSALELGIGPEHLELLKKEISLLSQSGEQLVLAEDWAIEPLVDRAASLKLDDLKGTADADIMAAIKKAANDAAKALQEGNRELAAKEKNRQRQLLKKVQERGRARREIAEVKRVLANQVRLKYADPQKGTGVDRQFLLQARKVVALYAPNLLTDSMRRELAQAEASGEIPSLRDFMAQIKDAENSEYAEDLIEAMPDLPASLETVQDWMDVKAIVQQLNTMGRNKNKLLYGEAKASLEATVQEFIDHMAAHHKAKPPKGWADVHDGKGSFKSALKSGTVTELTKMQFILRMADGWDPDGPFTREIWNNRIKRADDAEITMKEKAFEQYDKLFERIPWEQRKHWRQRTIQIPGVPVTLTMEEIMKIALNSGNTGNLKALTQSQDPRTMWLADRKAHQAVLDYLDEDHWALVEDIWEYLDQFFPMLQDVHYQMTGIMLPKVEPREFETRTGKHKGGYYPLLSNPMLSHITEAQAEAQIAQDQYNSLYGQTSPRSRASHARKGSRQFPMLNFGVIAQHVQDVIHDITHRAAIRDVQRMVTHPRFREAFIQYFGKEYYDEFRPFLKDLARPEPGRLLGMEKFFSFLRKTGTIVALAGKMTVVIKQPLALTQAMHEVGSGWVSKSMIEWGKNPNEMIRFARENSAQIRDRMNSWDREAAQFKKGTRLAGARGGWAAAGMQESAWKALGEVMNSFTDRYQMTRDQIADALMWPIAYTDLHASVIAWKAEYNKRISEGRTHQEAVDFADNVVSATAGSARVKDMARFYRKKGFVQLLGMFQTFFSSSHNLFMEIARRAHAGNLGPIGTMRAMWLLAVMPVALNYLFDQRDLPDEPQEVKDLLVGDLIGYLLGGVPVARDIWNSAYGGWGYSLSPVSDFFESGVYVGSALLGQKNKIDAETFARNMTIIMGYLTGGIPARQAIITARGIRDLSTGKTSNPARLLLPERRKK